MIPPPGAANTHVPLLEQLLRDGHVRIPPGRRGLELAEDVTCVGADGTPSRGLSAIGRPTEDWVIGNDTLNRALHPQPDLWARRVISQGARPVSDVRSKCAGVVPLRGRLEPWQEERLREGE